MADGGVALSVRLIRLLAGSAGNADGVLERIRLTPKTCAPGGCVAVLYGFSSRPHSSINCSVISLVRASVSTVTEDPSSTLLVPALL